MIAGWQSYMAAGEFRTGDGVCPGDSGGPAFEQTSYDAGELVALGVLSRGGIEGSSCVTGVYTRFDAWATLATDTARDAAKLGGYAPPVWAQPSEDAGTVTADAAPPAESGAPDAGIEPPRPSSGCALAPPSGGRDAAWVALGLLSLLTAASRSRRRLPRRSRP